MLYLLRLTMVLVLSTIPAAAGELKQTVQQVMEQTRKDAARMEVPDNKHQRAGMKAALESAKVFNSPEFQEKLQCEQQRLKKELFSNVTPVQEEKDMSIPDKLAENEKVYLFFSSSMPDETIYTYLKVMEGLEEPGMTMLMKGFVPGKRSRYLLRITQKDRSCVDQLQQENPEVCERFEIPIKIQPSLFEQYEITEVPAVIYEREGMALKIVGDARLDYLLERINREAKSPGLKGLVSTLQEGEYD